MKMTTANGSVYELDLDDGTWTRNVASDRSGLLRTDGGVLWSCHSTLDRELVIIGPSLTSGRAVRAIFTSAVTEVNE